MTERILITGAAGRIGAMLRTRLARPGRCLRLLDIAPLTAGAEEEVVTASVSDRDAMVEACDGVDAVVHLAGHPGEAPWPEILAVNVDGTHSVFEAARRAGVARVVYASSNHAAGYHPAGQDIPDHALPRPDTYYGVSKVVGEALGSLYHDRHGMDVVCLRIGTCTERPRDERGLGTWLSPDDCGRLVEACLSAPAGFGYRPVWGISANTRAWWSQDAGRELGYVAADDAEPFAGALLAGAPAPDFAADPRLLRVGGRFCTMPLGVPA